MSELIQLPLEKNRSELIRSPVQIARSPIRLPNSTASLNPSQIDKVSELLKKQPEVEFVPSLKQRQRAKVTETLSAVANERGELVFNWLFNTLHRITQNPQFCIKFQAALESDAQVNVEPLLLKGLDPIYPVEPTFDAKEFDISVTFLQNIFESVWKFSRTRKRLIDKVVSVAIPQFFKTPTDLSPKSKAIFLGMFDGVQQFFDQLDPALRKHSRFWVDYSKLNDPRIAKDVYQQMIENFYSHRRTELAPLSEHLEEFFDALQGIDKTTAVVLSQILERSFSALSTPEMIAGLIQKSANADWDGKVPKTPDRPLEEFDCSDHEFSKQLNARINVFSDKLSDLGAESGIGRVVARVAVKTLLMVFPDKLGEKIQQGLNRVMRNDFHYVPVLMMDRLLRGDLAYKGDRQKMPVVTKETVNQRFLDLFTKHNISSNQATTIQKLLDPALNNLLMLCLDGNIADLAIRYILRGVTNSLKASGQN